MPITSTVLPSKSDRHRLFGSVDPVKGDKPTDKETMPDLQNADQDFLFPIHSVGVTGVKHPITLPSSRKPFTQTTVADFTLTTSLAQNKKGINMSRLTEVLHEFHGEQGFTLSAQSLQHLTETIATRMEQRSAQVTVSFPWFFERESPVMGKTGLMNTHCSLSASFSRERGATITAGMTAKVTTLCPCSKEISEYSAHNQRGNVTIEAQLHKDYLMSDWKETLLSAAESNASSLLYPVLKRPDEKSVTETAYENPRFVEDLARLAAADLYEAESISRFSVECRNEESIHLHDAVARIEVGGV
ncbi:GTP cyclohydrolase I FolE2 [Alteribacter lacisalsi]|uniref:GTP cyclohydrolase FolE2 n=1 Tax=Alteribacter lacisalsi TaxID=2045244 RepID=A0A2W0HV46_9BACI|nr:GTP cyclohydrolase FolE2 [Alteribacter lacisalsi]PYZ97548.1 GTP cyclohydrolase I FolE2 [Alteribacter lacisalsi]